MLLKKYLSLYWLQSVLAVVNTGFVSLLSLYFYKAHVSLAELLLAEGLGCLATCVYILVRRVFYSRLDIQLGFVWVGLGLALLLFPFSKSLFYWYVILRTIGGIIFYIPYNIILFREPQKDRGLEAMTWYWGITILTAVVAPLVCGWLLSEVSHNAFVAIALAFIMLGVYLARKIKPEAFRFSAREIWSRIKGFRTITIVDGALHRSTSSIFLFALLFITNAGDYGRFLSAVAVAALIGGVFMARKSDRSRERMAYIWPLTVCVAFLSLAFIAASTFKIFLILAICVKFFTVLIEPIRAVVLIDQRGSEPVIWVSRELFLNIGRTLIYAWLSLLVYLSAPWLVFVSIAVLHVAFPLLIRLKKVYHPDLLTKTSPEII